jgi:hypothetical protein
MLPSAAPIGLVQLLVSSEPIFQVALLSEHSNFSLNIFLTCLYPRSIVFDENFESAMFIENINFSERSEHNFSNEGGVSDFSNE